MLGIDPATDIPMIAETRHPIGMGRPIPAAVLEPESYCSELPMVLTSKDLRESAMNPFPGGKFPEGASNEHPAT